MEKTDIKIGKIESSNLLPQEEKRKLLWQVLDLIFSENNLVKQQKIKCKQKKK